MHSAHESLLRSILAEAFPEAVEQWTSPVDAFSGFASAQERVIDNILRYEGRIASTTKLLKQARKERKSASADYYEQEVKELHWCVATLRTILDTIAWSLMRGQHYLARRLYSGNGAGPLSGTNISSVRSVLRQFNAVPNQFAIAADATSFIQICDVLTVCFGESSVLYRLGEVKEGAKNDIALDFARFAVASKLACQGSVQLFAQQEGIETVAQAARILRQQARLSSVAKLINTGASVDFDTGAQLAVHEDDELRLKSYDTSLESLVTDARRRGWAIDVIDDSLFVGVYRSDFPGPSTFRGWLQDEGSSGPTIKLAESVEHPLAWPIFLRAIDNETIFDTLFGRLDIVFHLNISAFMKLAVPRESAVGGFQSARRRW